MRIICPSCTAIYDVVDSMLPPGRATRCTRCGHQWVPTAVPPDGPEEHLPEPDLEDIVTSPPDDPPAPPPAPAGPTAIDRLRASATEQSHGSFSLKLAWAASIALLLGCGATLYVQRAALIAAWPPSLRLYAVLGLAPGPESPHPSAAPKQEGTDHGAAQQQRPAGNHGTH